MSIAVPSVELCHSFPQADTVMSYVLTRIMSLTYHYTIACSVMEGLNILQDQKKPCDYLGMSVSFIQSKSLS